MAETSYPFPQTPATVGRWARMARLFGLSSILTPVGQNPYGLTVSGLTATIGRGTGGLSEAFVRGFMHTLDAEDYVEAVPANTAAAPLIDRYVLRMDLTTETVTVVRLRGAPAASPTPPGLTQTNTVWDLPLWRLTVPANSGAPLVVLGDDRYYSDVDTGWAGYVLPSSTTVEVFTASGTWTKNPLARSVEVVCIGGGGGGSSSYPGAGGGRSAVRLPAAVLPASVPVTVGAGGGGGSTAQGAMGAVGAASSFGTFTSATGGNAVAVGSVPSGGQQGGMPTPASSTAGGNPNQGGAGSNTALPNNNSGYAGAGGGGASNGVGLTGGTSGSLTGGAGGNSTGSVAATAGQSRSGSGLGGSGGGGGSGVISIPGAAGGVPGGGGGGGYYPYAGGSGGRGEVIVTTYF